MLSLVIMIALLSALALGRGFPSPAVGAAGNCNILTAGAVPFVGQSGTIRFNCNAKAAFSANGNLIPSFTLAGTGYTSLGIVLHSSKNCTPAKTIKSGVTFSFGSKADYDYCAIFQNPSLAKLGTVRVIWATR